MIRPSDRVAEVLRNDASLIEAFVAASPVFQGLRNPAIRKTMGRLATIEQAARVAGMDPEVLAERLNRARSGGPSQTDRPRKTDEREKPSTERDRMPTIHTDAPARLAKIPADQVVDLDVREDLRNGQEPFSRIMAARREVPPGGVLRLRAIFEPVPLYAVMAKQGFDHWTEELAADDWRVWFYPAQAENEAPPSDGHAGAQAPPATPGPAQAAGEGEDVIVLDVRGMEPPEPMVRTLAALETLPTGKTLLQINERLPLFLLPKLEELGFQHQVRQQNDGLVRVFIRRTEDS